MLLNVLASLALILCVKDFTNPIALHAADPWLVYHNGFYHLLSTTGSNYIGIRKAQTLEGLKTVDNTIVYTLEGLSSWAPEIHPFNGKWYLYYTSCNKMGKRPECHRNRVAESVSDDPMGPYHHKADLIDPNDSNYEIDPSVIIINFKTYLLGSYKNDSYPQKLYIRELSNPYTAVGPKHMLSTPTYVWEEDLSINEGPEPLYHNNRTFLVFSASSCGTPNYKLGLLEFVGTDPLNHEHWHKHSTPVFERNDENQVYGPGHNGFFKSPDGTEDWIVYHSNDSPNGGCNYERSTRAQKFTWSSDGFPLFGEPQAIGVKLQEPSG